MFDFYLFLSHSFRSSRTYCFVKGASFVLKHVRSFTNRFDCRRRKISLYSSTTYAEPTAILRQNILSPFLIFFYLDRLPCTSQTAFSFKIHLKILRLQERTPPKLDKTCVLLHISRPCRVKTLSKHILRLAHQEHTIIF